MTTLTRSYDSYPTAKQVVTDLKAAGFNDSDISLVAHRESDGVGDGIAAGAGVGAAAGGTLGLLTGLGIMAIPGVGPVVAAGWLAATAAGAAAGAVAGGVTGGIIDALVDNGVSRADAEVYAENVRRGGTVVSVRTDDARRATAEAILDRQASINLADRRGAYTTAGWTGYSPDATPLTRAEIEAERARYR